VCTVVILHRPGHAWPLLLAANRDERLDRAWDGPAAHWPDRPGVVGGRDRSGGGSWMAMGPRVVAAALNRPGSLGPAAGKLSRGVLPLMAAEATSAGDAVARIAALDAGRWRPFNLVVADATRAVFLRGLGEGRPQAVELGEGLHMVTAHDPNDPGSPRTARHLPRFRAAPVPDPAAGDWAGWQALLADDSQGPAGIGDALRVPPVQGFGTVCASLAALGAGGQRIWRFCPGPAGTAPFHDVTMEETR
jgi:hypothetical protein